MFKIYFILFITLFSFIGLPTIQSVCSFSYLLKAERFDFDLSSEEEETNQNESETKELEQKLIQQRNSFALFLFNQINSVAFHKHLNTYGSFISEVNTPPPEI